MTFHVKDFRKPGMNDDDCIAACLSHCRHGGSDASVTIVFDTGEWRISGAILLSGNMTVVLDGALIKQNDGAFDNVFRGDNIEIDPEDPFGWPLSVRPLKNIKILGKNGAKISGPDVNRRGFHTILQNEQDMTGDFWGWRTLQICLSKCDGFEIAGLSFINTRCWAMAFDLCCNGEVHNIHFDTRIKNGDGIDFEPGCHHCKVWNIRGRTADDSIALHALVMRDEYPLRNYLYPMKPALHYPKEIFPEGFKPRDLDIHDIEIFDVETSGDHHGVVLIAYEGIQIYNVTIRKIRESGEGKRWATVSLYTGWGYSEGYRSGDMHDINIDSVSAEYAACAFECRDVAVKNVTVRNVTHKKADAKAYSITYPEGITIQ
jgi:hypothetical protein